MVASPRLGEEEIRERKEKKEKERREKREIRKREEKKKFSGFQNINIYPSWILETRFRFLCKLVRVSNICNYGTRSNFQVPI